MTHSRPQRMVPPHWAIALLALAVWAAAPLEAGADDSLGACADCHGIALAGGQAKGAPNLTVLPSWYVERQLQNYQRGFRTVADGASDAHALDSDGIAAATALAASMPMHAAAPTLDGDAERGSSLYRTCATCHGERGRGNQSLNAPPLAGQNDWYLVRQLESYQAGRRGGVPGDIWGAQMRASTAVLGDEDAVRDVVAHISTFKPDGVP